MPPFGANIASICLVNEMTPEGVEPIIFQGIGQFITWSWCKKNLPGLLLQNTPKWVNNIPKGVFRKNSFFDKHVLLCVLVHYHPDTWHHLKHTLFKPLGAHSFTERPWQWCVHLAQEVGLGHFMILQPLVPGFILGMQLSGGKILGASLHHCSPECGKNCLKLMCIGTFDKRFGWPGIFSQSIFSWTVLVETGETKGTHLILKWVA